MFRGRFVHRSDKELMIVMHAYGPLFSASSVQGSSVDKTKFETSTKCEAGITASMEFSMFPWK